MSVAREVARDVTCCFHMLALSLLLLLLLVLLATPVTGPKLSLLSSKLHLAICGASIQLFVLVPVFESVVMAVTLLRVAACDLVDLEEQLEAEEEGDQTPEEWSLVPGGPETAMCQHPIVLWY